MTGGFDWKRFWCPRGESIDLSDHGFLFDPEGRWSRYANPALVTFQTVLEGRCAVLLGEPGIGKSWAIKRESAEIQRSLTVGAKMFFKDLRSFGDESRLMDSLFDSELFESWRKGDWTLHVFLDSLDECLLRIDNVATLIADELPKQPIERLRLRIACRPAPWPTVLEKALLDLFGECQLYELAPLRRVDVQRAAEQSGIVDPNKFLGRNRRAGRKFARDKTCNTQISHQHVLKNGDVPKELVADCYQRGVQDPVRRIEREPSQRGPKRATEPRGAARRSVKDCGGDPAG